MFDERIENLSRVALFEGCSRRELQEVAHLADEVHLDAGTVLMREGRIGHECFVLIDGEARVSIRGQELARLGAGEIVGEMALVEQEPRSATVIARTDIRALVMTQRQFTALIDRSPTVGVHVLRSVAQRLRNVQAA